MISDVLTDQALDTIFCSARTVNGWLDKEVPDDLLRRVYDVMKWGPTSANSCPLRVVFVTGRAAKERLKPFLLDSNVEKTMAAPATAIFAQDMQFYDHLHRLFPHTDARSWFAGNDTLIRDTAFRNSSLQAAYFIIAARALGLDCGPMSGFDADKVNKEFFPDGRFRANFICNIGYGDPTKNHPRNPRFDFDEVCKIV